MKWIEVVVDATNIFYRLFGKNNRTKLMPRILVDLRQSHSLFIFLLPSPSSSSSPPLLLLLFVVFFCEFGTHCQHCQRVYELYDYKDDDVRAIQFTFVRVSRCKNNKRIRFQHENSNESAIKSSESQRSSVVVRRDTPNKCRTWIDRRRAQSLKTLLCNKKPKRFTNALDVLEAYASEWIESDDEWVPQRAE